jgi:hypothetical protein
MDEGILGRRRLSGLFATGSLAVPAAILAGCATGKGAGRTRPPRFHGGGNGDKAGGGPGAKGSRH